MSRSVSLLRTATVLFLLVAAASASHAADGVAVVKVTRTTVEWQPLVEYEALLLRIAPPDGLVRQARFAPREVPVVLFDGPQRWPDGVYTYELVVAPRLGEQLRSDLLAARERDDDEEVYRLQKLVTGPVVQSGTFTISGGVGVPAGSAPDAEAPRSASSPAATSLAAPDQLLGDDLIVGSSACVGGGCVVNEDFALDTLRLKIKDSVVRVKFEDTSTGGPPFPPSRDWQLTMNDQLSGADYFRIEDVTGPTTKPFSILGGAPDNALWIASDGSVGLRTSAPATELHVASGNLPELRLDQTTLGGFPAQVWDVQGDHLAFAVQDVTNAKTPFKIAPNAPTNSVQVAANGNTGIGTAASPAYKLDVSGDVRVTGAAGYGGALPGAVVGAQVTTFVSNGYAGLGGIRMYGLDTLNTIWQSNLNTDMAITTNGGNLKFATVISGTQMILNGSGSVGIGTVSPSSRLHVVGGDIRVSGGSFIDDGVTLNAPDYVLQDGYRLMPLGELASYLAREKHLPNVPSAADIHSDGLNISQFQMRLLEKIEELTLYAIGLETDLQNRDRQIESLEVSYADLLKRVDALESPGQKDR